ncbi:MAG TPA: ABC transporter permease [Chryseosolibacter sp.]
MLRYNLLLFVRNLRRQKLFSTINLLGLTVSLSSTILIHLYVQHELSFDSFHPNTDRLYRVNQTFIWSESRDQQFSRTGPGVATALHEELAEVEMITSLHTPGTFIVSYVTPLGEVITHEENEILAADTNFFRIFNFPIIAGNADAAFRQANNVVMTKSTAEKYFGSADPIGKQIRLGSLTGGEEKTYEVTAVVEDTPDNSTIQFDLLLSMKGYPIERLSWSWVWTQLETFVLLDKNANIENVRQKLSKIPEKRAQETLRRVMNTSWEEYKASGKEWELFLQPIKTLHLPEFPVIGSFPDTGNIKIIYAFIGAAIFVILLSCINFMNLSTAQFTRRLKEVSVRKILGQGKKQLGASYFIEALIFCAIALVGALALSQLLLPVFNLATGKNLQFNISENTLLLPALLVLAFLMAVFSSSYPAIFLNKFNPVEAIKGKLKVGRQGAAFRNGLVVFQFSVSIVLMISTAIVYDQLNYVSEKDLGFDKENLVVIKHAEALKDQESLKQAALNLPGAMDASLCSSAPPTVFGGDSFSAEGLNGQNLQLNFTSGDERFIPTLGVKMKFGRNFSIHNPSDVHAVVINESTVRKIGWTLDESVIGKKILYPNSDDASFEVIGVVEDFNYWSLATAIEPMAIFHVNNPNTNGGARRYVVVRVKPQSSKDWQRTLAAMDDLWKRHAGDIPFDYQFIDEQFAETFKTQQQFGSILTGMALLAIIIASLGLLGMIVYALEQRTKEIGIRKVSGASVWNILVMISQGYTKLIIIAFVLGAPLAYWLMSLWLEDFAFRVQPSPVIFIVTGVSTLVVAILITGYHSLKAARMNPVDILKDE